MKKIKCFLVAALTSIIMFVSASLILKLSYENAEASNTIEPGLIVLQILLLVKYAAVLAMLLPAKVSINQLALGFLSADLAAGIISINLGSFAVLPVQIIALQGLMLVMYEGAGNYRIVTTATYKIPYLKKRLITEQ